MNSLKRQSRFTSFTRNAIGLLTTTSLVACGTSDSDAEATAKDQLLGSGPLFVNTLNEYPSIDGTGNNESTPLQGATDSVLLRGASSDYGDGVSSLSGQNRPSPRVISNTIAAQNSPISNSAGATDMFWLWGQFLDHDLDLSLEDEEESAPIVVPSGDTTFDPNESGEATIGFHRSVSVTVNGVHEQLNALSAYIDGTNVYGSDAERQDELRALDGSGRLKVSAGDLLPFNTAGLPNAGGPAPNLFLAGDIRANEQVYLSAMHTLWVREHNSWADYLNDTAPWYSGDDVYNLARVIVIGEMQAIVYEEFLPLLLGKNAISPYAGYDASVDASITNEFSTAAYRFGHTMLSGSLQRIGENGESIPAGPLTLRQAFFNPIALQTEGLTPYMLGAAGQAAQEIDNLIVDDVRNFLFSNVSNVGLDLASLNLQRGRDHGLSDYNATRVAYGLSARASIAEISSNPETVARLNDAYDNVNDMDLWITGLAEDHVPGAMIGETFHAIATDQFQRLRDGDRFYYENHLPENLVQLIKHTRLSTIVRRNTQGTNETVRYELFRTLPAAQTDLLGFEDEDDWTVTNGSISSSDELITDGSSALTVTSGGGNVDVTSAPLSSGAIAGSSSLSFDVYVPVAQPNPWWVGSAQAYMTCPSVGIHNNFIGQLDLNNVPRGQFVSADFDYPSDVESAVSNGATDCRITITLQVNATSEPFRLDRLAFD